MSDYFLGEIRMFPWAWAPKGWALCNGASLQVQQNQALFALLNGLYGGNSTTFNLPDLRGRAAIGMGTSAVSGVQYPIGVTGQGGAEQVALSPSQIPAHAHPVVAADEPATVGTPGNNYFAQPSAITLYAPVGSTAPTAMHPTSVSNEGGGQGHPNMQPYLPMNYCIAIVGVFPPRS